MVIETKAERETYELGFKMGEQSKAGQVYTLIGELGVGKTVFTQGLAAGLGISFGSKTPTQSARLRRTPRSSCARCVGWGLIGTKALR